MKKYLEEFHKLKIFRKEDVVAIIGDENTAKDLLRRYKQQGLIAQVRRNLYTAADMGSKASVANKYEIAGRVTALSYASYHSALEYHGLAHQVFYDVQVSSRTRFRKFDFEGMHYTCVQSEHEFGIISTSLAKVTDLERTVLDCLDNITLAGGLEEIVNCFSLITYLDEQKLLVYLEKYQKQILYQKTGFMLSLFAEQMKLSDTFFNTCHTKKGLSIRYLTEKQECETYFKKWQIFAPGNVLSMIEQGGTSDV